MAWSLAIRVGDTSASDVSLTSSGVHVENYGMTGPEANQAALASLGDGHELSAPSWSNVTETIDILVKLSTAALVADKIAAIERALELGRRGTTGVHGEKVYLLIQFDQDSEAWRSQILAAKLELAEPAGQIWKTYAKATLIVTRRFFWETAALRSLAVSSGPTGTPTTGYATVYNADNTHGTNQNWFNIAASQVPGTLPAPLKLFVRNDSGSPRSARAFYFGNYTFHNPSSLDPVYRDLDAAGSDPSWTSELEWTTYYWSLTDSTLINAFKGALGRIVVAFSNRPEQDTLLRAVLQYREPAPVIDLSIGDQILAGTNTVIDLGSLPIPPNAAWSGMGEDLYISLLAQAADSGGDTLAVDWMQVFPSGPGLYRVVKAIGPSWSIAGGDELVDDGTINAAYTLLGGRPVPAFVPYYTPLYVWPNRTNRLRMIVQGNTALEPGQPWGIHAELRPRRLTV